MKLIESKISIEQYVDFKDLNSSDQSIVQEARKSLETAYAPYSRFRVGAALRLTNGKIYHGSNQENAAYSLCLCAERVALFSAAVAYPQIAVKEIAVIAQGGLVITERPVTPCGACRQVLCEFETRYDHPIRLILEGKKSFYIFRSAKDLLPFSFDQSFLPDTSH